MVRVNDFHRVDVLGVSIAVMVTALDPICVRAIGNIGKEMAGKQSFMIESESELNEF